MAARAEEIRSGGEGYLYARWTRSDVGQAEKNSARAYLFRIALQIRYCSMQSACLKGAINDQRSA
jgi:hypothetical protein